MELSSLVNESLIPIWTVFVFALGLCVGSFLNVCIWRIPRNESIVSPGSHCPECDNELAWYENIPLLSWLCLKGRCRKCKNPITVRYFIVELLTGILFLGVWFRLLSFKIEFHAFIGLLIGCLIVTVFAILTAFIDFEHYIIPNKITYPVLLYGLFSAPLFPELWLTSSRWKAFSFACASVVVCGGILALFAVVGKKIFKKDALGWGDVKYIAALAAVLGPISCFFTLLVGSILGTFSGLVLIIVKKKKLKSPIPFGVCLALGTYFWIIFGKEALIAYLRFSKELAEKLAG
jgi:leader peptidase (prepilin peptidase) / N-methyltransferase